MKTKTFNEWLPGCEADLRNHVQHLHSKYSGWRLGIDQGDLFHDVVVKLSKHNHLIETRGALFGLVSKTALHHVMDLSEKHSFRSAFYSKPMPSRLRPRPGSSMETVVSKDPSPVDQAVLTDMVSMIANAAKQDPTIESLFLKLSELSGKGEPVTTANVARHLHLPSKTVSQSLKRLRSVACRML